MIWWANLNRSVIVTYGFLYLSVILLWLPKIKGFEAWWVAAFLSIILGLISHQLSFLGVAIIAFLAMLLVLFIRTNNHQIVHLFLGGIIFLFSLTFVTHILPGFHNLKILDRVYIGSGGIPFSLYLNIDKTFMGLLIIGLTHPLIERREQLISVIKNTLPLAIITIIITMLMAIALGFVYFDVKIPNEFLIWSVTNLLFVCLAEEALFRGFLQRNLTLILRNIKFSGVISILISALLFGLAHHAGGWKYVLLATVAGVGYGAVYYKTQRIEASILTHFSLNTIHFLCVTYPALAT